MTAHVRGVLFDLDGTLIDSAPDLAGAANDMRTARAMPPLPFAQLRPMVGSGARGMIGRAFGIAPQEPGYDALRDEFLQRYEARMTQLTVVFPEVASVLERLSTLGFAVGIVTNKATRFAAPLVRELRLARYATNLVCGDTTAHAKPHPAPLLEAASRLAHAPADCVYVGDDLRDVQAGRAAGMRTLVASWGYLGEGEAFDRWGADGTLASPIELLAWLDLN